VSASSNEAERTCHGDAACGKGGLHEDTSGIPPCDGSRFGRETGLRSAPVWWRSRKGENTMTQHWGMKPVGAMTAAEIRAALDRLDEVAPEDTALELALRHELYRVASEDWMFDEDSVLVG
jgi:hypothetical protein